MTLQTFLFLAIVSSDWGCLPPTMESSEQEVVLTDLQRTIECPLKPFPLTEIKWRYNKTNLDWNERGNVTMDGRKLTIHNKNISGYFVCFVDNKCGRETSTGIMVKWTNRREDIRIDHTPYVVINARNVGKCFWYKQRWETKLSPITEVSKATSVKERILSVGNHLYIKYLSKDDDGLRLMCFSVQDVFTFLLLGKPEVMKPKILIPQFPNGIVITVTKKETVLVPCIYVGGDYDTISYFIGDNLISTNTLPISMDRDDYYQTFTCVPSHNGTLMEKERRRFYVIYHEIPTFGDSLASVNITMGENASFTCEAARGFPQPEISFHVDDYPVEETSDMYIHIDRENRKIIKVFNASRSMSVRCRLDTGYAKVDQMVYLKIIEPPWVHVDRHDLKIFPFGNLPIRCSGRVDPLRILTLYVLWDYQRIKSNEFIRLRRNKYTINTITVQFAPGKDFINKMEGYKSLLMCVVSDGFTTVNSSVSLTYNKWKSKYNY